MVFFCPEMLEVLNFLRTFKKHKETHVKEAKASIIVGVLFLLGLWG
jgi:hypothetical protein